MNPNRPRKKQIPLYLMLVVSLALAGIFFRLQQTSTASADTNDVALAETTYPNIVHSRIDTCALCHTSSIPNLNPFGAAYMAQGRFLASSLRAIEAVDSDGDGFTNIREIAALTFPGNPADHPVLPKATRTPFQPPNATARPTSTSTTAPTGTRPSATATATQPGGSATLPSATATKAVTATKQATATKVGTRSTPTARPNLRSTVIPTCASHSDDDRRSDDQKETEDSKNSSAKCKDRTDDGDKHESNDDKDDMGGFSSYLQNNFFGDSHGGG